uniref:SPARK domain-containing protein n=1 Tax=Kalanchoe fedtschenkoi TaxID=63787 RepID=A0A7N0TKV4_KALFE
MNQAFSLSCCKGSYIHQLLLFVAWLFCIQDAVTSQIQVGHQRLSRSGLFDPIEVSPTVFPNYTSHGEPSIPVYPALPPAYDPILSGKCPVSFADISSIMEKTALDCSQLVAPVVANVICCPQVSSLLRIVQGYYSRNSDKLVLQNEIAEDCMSDIFSILSSKGGSNNISTLCSIESKNLTGGSCPVKDVIKFEKIVNASKLLNACSSVDPLKESCRPTCQPAIAEAALHLSAGDLSVDDAKIMAGERSHIDVINDCKGVVYAWLSRKLSPDASNKAFRILTACKVNKEFEQPLEVIRACKNVAAPSPLCCSSLNTYIEGMQNQMLITNKQAILCSTMFGSLLRKGGVLTNVYRLCDVDLKDFSLQVNDGQPGCLLPSLPADVVYDNITGFGFTCDLSDNIEAPWPLSTSITSFSLCASEMSLPARPTSGTLKLTGMCAGVLEFLVFFFMQFVVSVFLR